MRCLVKLKQMKVILVVLEKENEVEVLQAKLLSLVY